MSIIKEYAICLPLEIGRAGRTSSSGRVGLAEVELGLALGPGQPDPPTKRDKFETAIS